jgi:hypothetical protein
MARLLLNIVAPMIALACCAAAIYFIVPLALAFFDLSQFGPGLRGLIAAAICLPIVVLGLLGGLLLYPVILRPIISDSEFWGWLPARAPINLPVVSRWLMRWYVYLYGPRHV